MRIRLLWAGLPALLLLALGGIPASAGGGGCFQPMTQGTGTTIELRQICFSPTVLTVQPGTTVTWINRDDLRHNVGGNFSVWQTIETLEFGQSFSRTFPEAGVFPYACTLHYGMTGAIVVSGASSLPVAHVAPALTLAGTTRGGPGSLILLLGLAAVAAIAGFAIGQWRRRSASA
jgi:plastocyanin